MNDLPPPFVVFALPRSRTFWLSRYLSYNSWCCGHDEVRYLRSMDDIKSWFKQPMVGTVETAAGPFWRLLKHYSPEARIATVRRPVEEVVESLCKLARFDVPVIRKRMQQLDHKLDQIEQRCDVFSVRYSDLNHEACCAALFEYCCVPFNHDPLWWKCVSSVNLQLNFTALMRYMEAYTPQLIKIVKQVKHRTIALMQPEDRIDDGVTFQVERFSPEGLEEVAPLAAEHMMQTDQAPDDFYRKNLPLWYNMQDHGYLQCLTARANGRLFGYLVTVIGPSMDAPGIMIGEHTVFFASPVIRNLGMRLQRAAVVALKERGVDNLVLRAGHRGAGPRLGTLYRRLGAEEFGHMWRLDLKDTV